VINISSYIKELIEDGKQMSSEYIDCQEERQKYRGLWKFYEAKYNEALHEKEQAENTRDLAQTQSTADLLAKRQAEYRIKQLEDFITAAGLTVPAPSDDITKEVKSGV